jgi:hypothetical protein
MEINFKYNIGDLVFLRQDVGTLKHPNKRQFGTVPFSPMLIIERSMQECPGGIQYFYHIRIYTKSSESASSGVAHYNEVELISASEGWEITEKSQEMK